LIQLGSPKTHRLKVVFADGSAITNFPAGTEAEVTIVFKSARAERHSLLFFPDGIIDSWIDESMDIVGARSIAKLADLAHRGFARGAGRVMPVNPLVRARQLVQEWRTNNRNPAQAKRNAEFHYALDPRFFELVLGETLGYSEGYWIEGTATLDQAKYNNYEYICRKLRLSPGDRVLEVGSGWGYMPILMAKKYGAAVTVYNPVKAQNDFMSARFERQGIADRIELFEKDHRDIAERRGHYDKFVSIGVQEHAGKDCYRQWIDSIATALKPGGIGVVSTTSLMHRELTNSVITRNIFPGGHIPSLPLMLQIMDECGLALIEVENLWPHYQRTLEKWRENFETRWDSIHALNPSFFNERFRRRWQFYLEGTVENFSYALDLSHIIFTKGRDAGFYDWTHDRFRAEAEFATGTMPVDALR
jgi:cyclopropane-fatty-acyl-phospholipid synthase